MMTEEKFMMTEGKSVGPLKKAVSTLVAVATSASLTGVASAQEGPIRSPEPEVVSTTDQDSAIDALANASFYDAAADQLQLDVDYALSLGAPLPMVENLDHLYQSLSSDEVHDFLEAIDFQIPTPPEGTAVRAIPAALIPIAKFLTGTAGAVIIGEIVLYGIGKACQNLEGQYDFFTKLCRTRGYI